MQKLRVGVVRGGPSSEYDVSLLTGAHVLASLPITHYIPIDILLTQGGEWIMNGVVTDVQTIAGQVDVVWNALHGTYGEDGKVQRIFDKLGVPYTGSGALASAIGMHKGLTKERLVEAGLQVPDGLTILPETPPEVGAQEVLQTFPLPVIVKPLTGGSSVATTIVRTPEDLSLAIAQAQAHGEVLVETFVTGKEATVCVLDNPDGGTCEALFPIEIVPPSTNDFFDYDAKYSGASAEICPGRFTLATHATLRDMAIAAHRAIGARHYSRTDFILGEHGIVALEVNTLPGLTQESLFPKALKAKGMLFSDFLQHVITLALEKRNP
jgi:D-alanine-D-alanine ligase